MTFYFSRFRLELYLRYSGKEMKKHVVIVNDTDVFFLPSHISIFPYVQTKTIMKSKLS